MKILNTLALTLTLAAPIAAQTATTTAPADVVGTWNLSVTTQQGQTIASVVKLQKDGDKIVGTLSSEMGEAPVTAEVKGKTLSIYFNFQGQNGPMSIEMTGTVDGDSAKGTMGVGGQTGGEWTATRAKAANAKETPKDTSAAAKVDLTGTYNVSVETPNINATPTVVLKQDGEKLTGDYVSAQYGKFPLTGTVKGDDVSFAFAMNVEGNGLNVTYTGKADKDGGIKGSVTYGDLMSGTFTATKKK
jgi:hypothetical protein